MISVEGIPNDNSGYNYSFGYVDYQFGAIIGQFTNLFQLKFALLPPFWVELFSAWGVCFFALFRIILYLHTYRGGGTGGGVVKIPGRSS